MVAFGAVSPIITKAYKRSTFDLVFTIAKAFGLVIGLMAITGIGPAALMTDDMIPFLWGSLVVPITLSIPLTGIAYVMMLNFGLVEFVGAFMRPIMQKIWKTPGESAIDAIVSSLPNAATLREHLIASHTPTYDVGRVAKEARVRTLVLTHLVPGDNPNVPDEAWTDEPRRAFGGEVVLGLDLMRL